MLSTLRLHNFIVIEEQTVQFDAGFTALSGESGAGKSVLVRALDFVCGGKLTLSPIRNEKLGDAEVEAQFTEVPSVQLSWLGSDEDFSEFVLRRTYSSNGRTRGWVNGRLVTQAQLQELAESLISITSQSQSVKLRHQAVQREFFDGFAGASDLAKRVEAGYSELTTTQNRLAKLRAEAEQSELRKANLAFIVSELGAVTLAEGRRGALETHIRQLSQTTKLQEQVADLSQAEVTPALSKAISIARELNEELVSRAESLRAEWEGLSSDLLRAVKALRADPRAQERLSDELAELARLERKYRTNDAGLLSMLEKARGELQTLEQLPTFDALESEVAQLGKALRAEAEKLSVKRKTAAKKLTSALQSQFKELGLDSLSLAVRLTEVTEVHAFGLERVEFVMHLKGQSADEGVALGAAASGGELSRIFLALMVACGGGANESGSDTLVFDEIDSGVSGLAARVVGDKLRELGKRHQVLCVTHLPQVASLATSNLRVTKTPGIPPGSSVERLNRKEKVEEIARMLAGYVVTDQARKSADELISSK